MNQFTKMAIKKQTVCRMLKENYEEMGESSEVIDEMTDDELLEEFVGAGFFADENAVAGMFDVIPAEYIDAEVVAAITGWPVDLREYKQ